MSPEILLNARNLVKTYPLRNGVVSAIDDVSFDIAKGETLGLVGESGCGKSTLGRVIMNLLSLDSGELLFKGQNLSQLAPPELRRWRRHFQMIFQDPFASLNPRATVRRILEEPLIVHGVRGARERQERVDWLLERVGLRLDMADRMPHEFSGGQRQRIGIARAIALNPELIICDEPVSALDVSIRAQVINLLIDLRQDFKLTYLFISHDLSIVRHIADRVAVMYLGNLVEIAPRSRLFSSPAHHYTQALLDSFPVPDPKHRASARKVLHGEVPSPLNPPSGCRFRTRCPAAVQQCAAVKPPLRPVAAGHYVACHFPLMSPLPDLGTGQESGQAGPALLHSVDTAPGKGNSVRPLAG